MKEGDKTDSPGKPSAADGQQQEEHDAARPQRSGADAVPAGDAAPIKGRLGKRRADKKAVELEALKDRLLRLQADFDNFRKRTLREKNDLRGRANEDIMLELLPVLDHIELALEAAARHAAPSAFIEGFRLVSEQLRAALEKFGLSVMNADGQAFDFNKHEAIAHVPSNDVVENHVVTQVRRGYMLGDYMLRPAQVVVSSGVAVPPAAAETED